MTAPAAVIVQLDHCCWEVGSIDSEAGCPHFDDEPAARALVQVDVDGNSLAPTVELLPAPCWVAHCPFCGKALEDDEFGSIPHCRSAGDAEQAPGCCPDGCEEPAPGPDPLRPSSELMDPIPGLDPP